MLRVYLRTLKTGENRVKVASMSVSILHNQPLSNYTTLHIGGVADYVAEVTTVVELRDAMRFALEQSASRPLVLGGGSNVLCSDDGYRGLVIINKITGYEIVSQDDECVCVKVGAGEVFDKIIEQTIADGYWGLENLSAIPGSVGATPIQNVGAYCVEIAERVVEVCAINTRTLEEKVFTATECEFGYRDSFFKTEEGKQWCVVSVIYRLHTTPHMNLSYKDLQPLQESARITQSDIRAHVIAVRSRKFPDWRVVGTAGSFFKNPIISKELFTELVLQYPGLPGFDVDEDRIKISLGWVLDKVCNLRGYREDSVRLYEEQALVLVAEQGATAQNVNHFAEHISKKVFEKTGISIEREVLSV